MKTRVIRTAITELDENEAYDLARAIEGALSDDVTRLTPTEKQKATALLFAAQMAEILG